MASLIHEVRVAGKLKLKNDGASNLLLGLGIPLSVWYYAASLTI